MKKLITLLAVILTASIWAQSPQKMSYQAVIRDASNTLATNTAVGMQISILQTTSTGAAVYVETQTPTTNANGLVSIEIGGGTVVSGTFSAIDWSAGPYFIKTETDPAGGTSYTITGTSQLLSVPYALSAGNVTGLEKITEGGNTGWRLIGQNPSNYGNIGNNAIDLSYGTSASTTHGALSNYSLAEGQNSIASGNVSTAMGLSTTASGNESTAMGYETIASGATSTTMGRGTTASNDYSTAMGFNTTASGTFSTAMGNNTTASGSVSTAMGRNIIASGSYTTAMGLSTKAEAYGSIAVGRYNIGGGNPTAWVDTDRLFEIGNGTSSSARNALTVYKNGNTDVNGVFRAQKNVWPTTGAGVEIAYDANWGGSLNVGAGYIQAYSRDKSNFEPLFIGATEFDPVNDNSTRLGSSVNRWSKVYAVNGTIQTSDRRMKKEIKNLNYGLNTVMHLRPVTYKWKKGNQDVNLGLIAQEVQKILPEVIDVGTDKAKTLGMKYTELIPVVIKATQEQQLIIEKQQKEIVALKKMVTKLLKRKIIASN